VGLSVTRVCRVLPRADLPSKRVMVQCRRYPATLEEETLVIEIGRNVYTQAYKALTRDFYLKF
ncbi:MAG: SAM-dependent methyltransferase, partial [Muribaculaceae bacterium]